MTETERRPLVPAALAYRPDGTPYSPTYGDAEDAGTGGLGQARHVFLDGNGLPQRWQGRESFVVTETGFGIGLNFLATWAAWKADDARCARLHFVSFEKHPCTAADLAALHAGLADDLDLATLAQQLRAHWPTLVPGFQRLHFDDGRITLTLVFGDAVALLPQLAARVDAFYLDDFSPAKNPERWSPALLGELARLAAPGATLVTGPVACGVREALAAGGWSLEKAQGYSGKGEMLRGQRPGNVHEAPTDRRAIVIGAGIAGSSATERLAARGWRIDLIDRADEPGQGASGNVAGVLRPLPSLDDNRLARLTRAGYLYARRHFAALAAVGQTVRWGLTGVLHLARDDVHAATQKRVVDTWQPPTDYLRYVERDEAARLAGWPVDAGGWWFAGGAWVQPPAACRANVTRHGERIRTHFRTEIARIERAAGLWHAYDDADRLIAAAPVLVLANAADARRFAPAAHLPLRAARGQVSHLPAAAGSPPGVVVCRLGYVTPAVDGLSCAGATAIADDAGSELRTAEHAENLAKLNFILPGYAAGYDPEKLDGRVGFRPMSPDRLPMIGPVADADAAAANPDLPARLLDRMPRQPGLWLIDGFGARGIVWSALAGELLASQIEGEPLPLEAELAAAVDPGRFLLRGKTRKARRAAEEQ